jgi:hypothetical protein
MPFSNEEEILIVEKSKLKLTFLIIGIGLFIVSLFNVCFCTETNCRSSFEAFLIGGIAMLTGGAAISWMANPFLIISWILLLKNKKLAWFFSLIALLFSLSFLSFQTIIENEAGSYNIIKNIRLGYCFGFQVA